MLPFTKEIETMKLFSPLATPPSSMIVPGVTILVTSRLTIVVASFGSSTCSTIPTL